MESAVCAAPQNIDLLDRHDFVNQIVQLLEVISENRSSCMFSLEGSWGTGKSFVLDMLCNSLEQYEKFIVFRYNCWQYDYYEEPLVAIVSSMLSSIRDKVNLLPEKAHTSIRTALGAVIPLLTHAAAGYSMKKFGLTQEDIDEVTGLLEHSDAAVERIREINAAKKDYDPYDSFNGAMETVQKELRTLAADRTVFVVVDELDRCLPEYAIKVLERLHHLFNGLDNTAVLLAVDRTQLDYTVQQIFGPNVKCFEFLRKFINFEITLPNTPINQKFRQKYAAYFAMFDETLFQTGFDYDEYFSYLFHGIDIRSQEMLMRRITTIHRMVYPYGNQKEDYITACSELFWMVLTYQQNSTSEILYHPGDMGDAADEKKLFIRGMDEFAEYASRRWGPFSKEQKRGSQEIIMGGANDVPQYIMLYWNLLRQKLPGTTWTFTVTDEANRLPSLEKVRDLLALIR